MTEITRRATLAAALGAGALLAGARDARAAAFDDLLALAKKEGLSTAWGCRTTGPTGPPPGRP